MKQFFLTCALVAAFTLPTFAAGDHDKAQGNKKATVNIAETIVAGDVTLKPGEYDFQCKEIDGAHVMVISQKGKEVAKLPCTPEAMKQNAKTDEYRTRPIDGKKVLSSILFKGDPSVHRVLPVPAS